MSFNLSTLGESIVRLLQDSDERAAVSRGLKTAEQRDEFNAKERENARKRYGGTIAEVGGGVEPDAANTAVDSGN